MYPTLRTPWIRFVLLSLSLLLVAGPMVAAEKAPVEAKAAPTLATELTELFAQEKHELAALQTALTEATDDAERLHLQRRVQAVKLRTEAQFMRLQARHAREKGRAELAERAEAHAVVLEKHLRETEPSAEPRVEE